MQLLQRLVRIRQVLLMQRLLSRWRRQGPRYNRQVLLAAAKLQSLLQQVLVERHPPIP